MFFFNNIFRKQGIKSAAPHQHDLKSNFPSNNSSYLKKKTFDFPGFSTDYAYREAVGRLKLLLADSYAPNKYSSTSSIYKSITDDDTDTDQTVMERPAFKEVSKYFPYASVKPYSTYSTTSSYKPFMCSNNNLQVPSGKLLTK